MKIEVIGDAKFYTTYIGVPLDNNLKANAFTKHLYEIWRSCNNNIVKMAAYTPDDPQVAITGENLTKTPVMRIEVVAASMEYLTKSINLIMSGGYRVIGLRFEKLYHSAQNIIIDIPTIDEQSMTIFIRETNLGYVYSNFLISSDALNTLERILWMDCGNEITYETYGFSCPELRKVKITAGKNGIEVFQKLIPMLYASGFIAPLIITSSVKKITVNCNIFSSTSNPPIQDIILKRLENYKGIDSISICNGDDELISSCNNEYHFDPTDVFCTDGMLASAITCWYTEGGEITPTGVANEIGIRGASYLICYDTERDTIKLTIDKSKLTESVFSDIISKISMIKDKRDDMLYYIQKWRATPLQNPCTLSDIYNRDE